MSLTRRAFQTGVATTGLAGLSRIWAGQSPAIIASDKARPMIPHGVASGDVNADSAVIWSRTDRPARMIVEYATSETFWDARRIVGPAALDGSDFTAKTVITGLPAGEQIFYKVSFESLSELGLYSKPTLGSFRTAPFLARPTRVVWGGDVCGQGFGINLALGGMKTFETMRSLQPDLFIHSGDSIYADNPLEPVHAKVPSWVNICTEAKSKVAETLAEFHGNHQYNLMDQNVRRFNAEVPSLVQWDDHETTNNWYPGKVMEKEKGYNEPSAMVLAARAKKAFFDYYPTRQHPDDPERIYRKVSYGPLFEVFLLDQRSYRGPNTSNDQTTIDATSAFMGREQLDWLKASLLASKSTWKVIASDMPIGLVVGDGPGKFEAAAQGDHGPALGRELEFLELFQFLKANGIKNVVWVTADVHYAAAHYYDPSKAKVAHFDGFWEFVAGPLHAGTFGPGKLDQTFGPEVVFNSIPEGFGNGQNPGEGYQFFGTLDFDPRGSTLTASLWNVAGKRLFSKELAPQGKS